MRRLFGFGRGPDECHLPLTEAAAGQLAAACLEDDPGERARRLTELLRIEPPLVLWAACQAKPWKDRPPAGVVDLAIWIADHGFESAFWDEDDSLRRSVENPSLREHWAGLADEACATARCAAHLAGESDTGPSYLCGLLFNAPAWLASCGTPLRSTESLDLPAWLVDWLQQIEQTPPRSFVPGWVVRARHRITGVVQDASPEDADGPPLGDLLSDARSVRSRWIETSDAAGRLLPRLILKLARLRQLETDFSTELEREKLEALKELAYGASHEINNPLANISTRAQTLMRDETDPERRQKLAVINAQAFRAHEMISDMMLFARPPVLEHKPTDLTALVDHAIAELREEAEAQGTSLFRVTADAPVVIPADANHLVVALKALCTNSLEALGRGGKIEVFVQPAAADSEVAGEGSWAEILVSDDGPGISPEVRRHLFDPYFSGREAGRGLGLGLSKCWAIVHQHGGRIGVASQLGRGTTFIITLPANACSSTPTVR